MEKLYNHINVFLFVTGDCNFEKPLAACGYSQGRDDDLDWEQTNTREKAPSDPWMPSGEDGRHAPSAQWRAEVTTPSPDGEFITSPVRTFDTSSVPPRAKISCASMGIIFKIGWIVSLVTIVFNPVKSTMSNGQWKLSTFSIMANFWSNGYC